MSSATERFLQKIDRNGPNGCWLWTGGTDPTGYGRFHPTHRARVYAHRHSFEIHFRPLQTGEVVHHKCAVRNCVNPEHLEAISQQGNVSEALLRRQLEGRIEKLERQVEELLEVTRRET